MTGNPPYLRYNDAVEVRQPDEDELIEKVVASMGRVNRKVFDKHRHAQRDAHAKSHGVLKGSLSVYANLIQPLRQGLFAEPREYPAVIRLSSAPGDIHDDAIRSLKGMAIKVLGAGEEKSQDLLLVNLPVLPFGTIAAYWEGQQKMEKQAGSPEAAQRITGEVASALAAAARLVGLESEKLDAIGASDHHILGETFHSMGAIRYGEYIAKISATPFSETVKRLTGTRVETDGNPSAVRDAVVEFFRGNEAEFEIRAQLCTGLEKMPVEDASVEWPESLAPHQPVARLTIPAQEAYSPERRVYFDDMLSFNPWHCLDAHRPLGSIMRARIRAYEASSRFRHEMNMRPRVEPRELSEIPD